jgi:hypothetical protein
MKLRYLLAGAFVAMFAIPGTASQLAVRSAASAPLLPSPGIATGGLFDDPHVAPALSITLPTRFTALDVGAHPLQSFKG